jgi:predicted nucleic acid-binding protein
MLKALQFTIHEIDHSISYHARQMVRQYTLSHSIEMGDALIAATALKKHELLCTGNVKHFTPISGLKLEHYLPN